MKLNNKGFAFSTMLYGTLALITVILYVILGINKGASDEIYFYGDEIEAKLNECVYEEVTLENCYSAHVGTCDPTPYHACLGISDSPTEVAGELISETLKTKVVTSGDGLYADFLTNRRYIYRGNSVKNYIKYANKVWRIVSVEPDGSLKLLDYTYNKITQWDTNEQDNWPTSTLKVFLNSNYLTTITDTSKIVSGQWESTIVYPSAGTQGLTIQEYNEQYNNQMSNVTSYAQVGILSVYDYMAASRNTACQQHMTTQAGCTSWLSNFRGWTLNINGDKTNGKYAFHFTSSDNPEESNKLGDDLTGSSQKVYPVITLDRNSVLLSGDGSSDNPYVLK